MRGPSIGGRRSFLTGGAKVQVPKRTFRNSFEPQLKREALENAVKSLRQDLVATAWVVRKPTRFGIVTSLELFDREQRLAAMMFGERAPEAEETAGWRRIAAGLGSGT